MMADTRYIFVTGGVLSSLGKGIASASIAALLQSHGYRVRIRKMDPYLNIDPGTMSPHQHGEVFVTEDGSETDLDLGHYERFTGIDAQKSDSITTGQVYLSVIERERRGDYLGGTVQVIPHITDRIKEFIQYDHDAVDFMIIEIGGTVGDIEGLPFIESIRQLGNDLGLSHVMYVHLTLLPYIAAAGELKTKPTQHSVKELLGLGIQPTLLLCRGTVPMEAGDKKKLSLFCNIPENRIFSAPDVDSIYQVPLYFQEQGVDGAILSYFNRPQKPNNLSVWRDFNGRRTSPKLTLRVGIVGKYLEMKDTYKSLVEAVGHASVDQQMRVSIEWIDSEDLAIHEKLNDLDGMIVPGGFGERGAEGMIQAIRYARVHEIPFLGICFGMQLALIESARHVAGIAAARSTEFGPTPEPVIALMTEWQADDDITIQRDEATNLGGTMRLGSYPCVLTLGTRAASLYNAELVHERHRHRYEFNIVYKERLQKSGVVFAGMSPDGQLAEIIERPDHPWFVGVQFHPELKSRPFAPHPLFVSFVEACGQRHVLASSTTAVASEATQ